MVELVRQDEGHNVYIYVMTFVLTMAHEFNRYLL